MEPGAETEEKLFGAITWWQKLWNYIKSIFQTTIDNPFEDAATKILTGDISDLINVPTQNEEYYQLVDPLQALLNDQDKINLDKL